MFGLLAELQRRWILWDTFRAVRKHGWTAIFVPAGEEPSFGYSVGFREAVRSPEIIMFGFTPEYVNGLVGEARRQLAAGELVLADKAVWALEDMPQLSGQGRRISLGAALRRELRAASAGVATPLRGLLRGAA